jgi:predicted Zn-dependent protease
MRRIGGRLLIGLVIALISIFTYFSRTQTNPVTGEKQRVSLTPEQEVAMGIQSAPQMAQEFGGLYPDPEVQNTVKAIGRKLVDATNARNSPYQFDFHVLRDPETINAFALPGGQVFITMGLLKQLKTEDQLAGVLGHEIGHVIGRHSAEQMAQQELTQGLAGAATIALSDPNSPNASAAIAQYVGNVINTRFGREDELESDRLGLNYMQDAGYQPSAMIQVMEILQEAQQGPRGPEMLSTHPYPENRIAQIRRILDQKKIGEQEGRY